MQSISPAFTRAAGGKFGTEPVFMSFTFWMLVWAVAIDDDRQRCEREKKRRKGQAPPQPRPTTAAPRAPKPF